jgi:hypothetical protein
MKSSLATSQSQLRGFPDQAGPNTYSGFANVRRSKHCNSSNKEAYVPRMGETFLCNIHNHSVALLETNGLRFPKSLARIKKSRYCDARASRFHL